MWLTLAVVIVLSLFDMIYAQAPGDAEPFCIEVLPGLGVNILDYAPQVKPLMDSRYYQNLLPPHADVVWQEVDNDNHNPSDLNTDWTQNSNTVCRQSVFVCGFSAGSQDNWIITQHISRVVGDTALPQVTVQVDFQLNSCMEVNNCGRTFSIHKYETSTITATAARNLSNYEFVPPRISPSDGSGDARENMSIQIDFDTAATGFYLGIRDETSCVFVHRVLVFYYVCPAETSDLITRPERIAPFIGNSAPLVVDGQCVENSSPENGIQPRLTCLQNGVWGGIDGAGCVCDTGFQRSLDGRSCIGCDSGMYLSVNLTCLPCPANSNSTQQGLSECPCFEGYFRAVGEPPERECTQPPSAPRNLTVLQVTNTSVQLSWDPPVSNGGRDDLEYQLSYQRVGVPDNVTVYGRLNVTVGQITGLRPFVQYVVMVSGGNGVSAQATDASGRTVSATITTEEGVPPAITLETVQVNEVSDIISWQPPAEPNGEILHYNIHMYHVDGDGNQELVDTVSEVQGTTFDFSTRGLNTGTYNIQIQAVTRVGVGEFSQSITLTIEGVAFPTVYIIIIVVIIIVLVVLVVFMGICSCVWYQERKRNSNSSDVRYTPSGDNQGHSLLVKPDTIPLSTHGLPTELKMISSKDICLLNSVGEGEFGEVYKAHWIRSSVLSPHPAIPEIVAVKTIKGFYNPEQTTEMMKEAQKMIGLDHPHVLTLIGLCVDGGPTPYIVMPFMANGSLLSYLKADRKNLLIAEDAQVEMICKVQKRLTDMCLQIAEGMMYLASRRIVHRDLAARNCMIDANLVIKIADFGLAESTYTKFYFRQEKDTKVKLPWKWLAPECLSDGIFSEKTDVWAFGITCWEVYSTGKAPYPAVDPCRLPGLLEEGYRLEKPANAACNTEMNSTMLQSWMASPEERPFFSELVDTISGQLESLAGYLHISTFTELENSF